MCKGRSNQGDSQRVRFASRIQPSNSLGMLSFRLEKVKNENILDKAPLKVLGCQGSGRSLKAESRLFDV